MGKINTITKTIIFILMVSISIVACGYRVNETISYASVEKDKIDLKSDNVTIRKTLYETIQEQGWFRAGVRPSTPPFGWVDEDGKRDGFEVELVKEIAKRLNLDVKFVDVQFQDTIPFTESGKVDLVAAVITHKSLREEKVDFSVTYFMDAERFLVRKDSGIKTLEDLKEKGILAVAESDSVATTMKNIAPEVELFRVSDYPEHYKAVEEGLANAVAGDSTFLLARKNELFKNPEDYEIVGEPLSYAPMGMLLPENESDWRDAINTTLNDMFKDGTFRLIYDKWFGPNTKFDMSSLGWKPEVWP